MERDKTESYRALYRVRPLIYHIGDLRLWMPIRQDGVVLWLVYVVVFFLFCYVVPILNWILPLDRTVTMVIGPVIAAYYTVKLDPAGKTVPRYLQDVAHFIVRAKWLINWRWIRPPVGTNVLRFTAYCRPYQCKKEGSNKEVWSAISCKVSGKVTKLEQVILSEKIQLRWRGNKERLKLKPSNRKKKSLAIHSGYLEHPIRKTFIGVTTFPVKMARKELASQKEAWDIEEQRCKGGEP